MDAQLRQEVVERFHADAAFRESVLVDANQAVKREFGVDLPFPVRVVAEGGGYRVEPVGGASDDLNDEQLELVSGGGPKGGSGPANPRTDPSRDAFRLPQTGPTVWRG